MNSSNAVFHCVDAEQWLNADLWSEHTDSTSQLYMCEHRAGLQAGAQQ